MTLLEARQLLDQLRDKIKTSTRLARPVGERLLGVRLEGEALTIWTESAMLVIEEGQVTLTKRRE